MFTGIVENVGTVVAFEEREEAWRLQLELPFEDGGGLQLGDSLAVDGCCLTVAEIKENRAGFDLLEETLARTTFRSLEPGDSPNLERSLPADGRVGGHFVTGHVDGVGEVLVFEERGKNLYLRVRAAPREHARYLIDKGSVALNGCSLTVCEVRNDSFAVWLIPHTLSHTNLQALKAGSLVNLEYDLLAKYVERLTVFGNGEKPR